IERALALAKEFKLKTMIAGGSEAYLVADQFKAADVPVLLSLNFPHRTAAPSADADPDPIRLLRERVQAPKTPGQLAKAGGKIANLTVTRGDLLSRCRVTQLFIDGKPVTPRPPNDAQGNATALASGAWTTTVSLEGTQYAVTLALRQDGEKLTGSLQGDLGA